MDTNDEIDEGMKIKIKLLEMKMARLSIENIQESSFGQKI